MTVYELNKLFFSRRPLLAWRKLNRIAYRVRGHALASIGSPPRGNMDNQRVGQRWENLTILPEEEHHTRRNHLRIGLTDVDVWCGEGGRRFGVRRIDTRDHGGRVRGQADPRTRNFILEVEPIYDDGLPIEKIFQPDISSTEEYPSRITITKG